MPKRNIVQIQLPAQQPDRCVDCPLLGKIPEYYTQRPKGSKETMVCLGTLEALTVLGSKSRASKHTTKHPLHRPCDNRWNAWMQLPRRKLGVSVKSYNECRIPYEQGLELEIKFHTGRGRKRNGKQEED